MAQVPMSSEHGVHGLPEHVRGFALMHVAMRRDARRLTGAASAVTASSGPAVATWWSRVRGAIDWHHHSEDEVLWPELRRRVRGFAAREAAIHGDHEALDAAMDAVSVALTPRGVQGLTAAATRFSTVLHEHLRAEEDFVFPVFTEDLTPQEYLAIERRVVATAPARVMAYLQPWMFDGADRRAVASVEATIPPPVRLLGGTVLRWRYERMVAPVRSLI
ncbi:hemerythrin domain-containing protein [Dactylosporangium sp. NPDC048998]|uniref:hemerythrin domain-containing protein n=1 Tax=Dactylosporangium sp. NPDC048998 TaxID=3363976 RepID=UPI003719E8C4